VLNVRVIPVLLVKDGKLVKTVRFKDPTYVGDPINALRIFNEKEVDELIFTDISATVERKPPPFDLIGKIASECFMPLAYCGGVRTIQDIRTILNLGVEKVGLNTLAVENSQFVKEASDLFGSQSIVVSIDVKKNKFGKYQVATHGGRKTHGIDPVSHAVLCARMGAGEILLNSIDLDGTMKGYDLDLLQQVTREMKVPVIACGGAGGLDDFVQAVQVGCASAVAAGSMFVFYGKHRAVLINYPSQRELEVRLSKGEPVATYQQSQVS
jgi:cyclase